MSQSGVLKWLFILFFAYHTTLSVFEHSWREFASDIVIRDAPLLHCKTVFIWLGFMEFLFMWWTLRVTEDATVKSITQINSRICTQYNCTRKLKTKLGNSIVHECNKIYQNIASCRRNGTSLSSLLTLHMIGENGASRAEKKKIKYSISCHHTRIQPTFNPCFFYSMCFLSFASLFQE